MLVVKKGGLLCTEVFVYLASNNYIVWNEVSKMVKWKLKGQASCKNLISAHQISELTFPELSQTVESVQQ